MQSVVGADAAPLIERECGVPVVTGAHADYWEAFRSLGINDRIEGHGRLMASLSETPKVAVAAHGYRHGGNDGPILQRATTLVATIFLLVLAPFSGAQAQDFPSRPVRFIVPYAAGGSGDLLARLLGQKLSACGDSRSWSTTSRAPAA